MNQREIKFRALFPDGRTVYFFWPEFTEWMNDAKHLEQFTGLHDKNGKEIYEGDVVKQKDHVTSEESHIRPVVFISGTFGAGRPYDFHGFANTEVEVIGNIHENKELLT